MAKTFSHENKSRQLYYYTIASPTAIIVSKIIYNVALMLLLAFVALAFYMLVFQAPLHDVLFYFFIVFLGSISLACALTMVAAIATKANHNATLMAILGFPIVIPLLMILIKLSKATIKGIAFNGIWQELVVLLAINLMVLVVSVLLFPYIWRD